MQRIFYILLLVSLSTVLTACERSSPLDSPKASEAQASAESGSQAGIESDSKTEVNGEETCGCSPGTCRCSKKGHRYSAFGVKLGESRHFDLVSFKDVGLESSPYDSEDMLEILAQSLAYELRRHESLDLSTRLIHDDGLAKPSEHTYCEARRLYVDVWHSLSPHRWGYSLWSGCSETFNFAQNEVPLEDPEGDLKSAIQPMTRSIADSLAEAHRQNCYKRRC